MKMKKIILIILLFNSSFIFAENNIIAIIGDDIITKNNIINELNSAKTFEKKIDIINNKINDNLIQKKALELGIKHSEKDINNAITVIVKQNNLSSVEEFKNSPNYSIYLEKIIAQLSTIVFRQLIYQEAYESITDKEIDAICTQTKNENQIKQIKLSKIIIYQLKNQENQELTIKKLLNTISKHVEKGGSFEKLKQIHSQEKSIEHEWTNIDELSDNFTNLKDNKVSDIYKYGSGWGIAMKSDERYIYSNIDNCKAIAIQEKAQEYYLEWIEKLRESSYIKIFYDRI